MCGIHRTRGGHCLSMHYYPPQGEINNKEICFPIMYFCCVYGWENNILLHRLEQIKNAVNDSALNHSEHLDV